MKATLKDRVIAESDDIVEEAGYHYFPIAVTRMEWLKKGPRPSPTIPVRMAYSSTM